MSLSEVWLAAPCNPAVKAEAAVSLLNDFLGSPSLATNSSLLQAVRDLAASKSLAGLPSP